GADEDLLFALGYALRRRNHEVVAAWPGEEAAWVAQVEQPALIVLDDDGFGDRPEPALGSSTVTGALPRILLTARSDSLADASWADWDAVVSKPFRLDHLVNVIEALGDGPPGPSAHSDQSCERDVH
ncbi:MAG TPA: hypothetical protein VHL09_12210, partial [Dehalococcoidia bacterium]|nr:hypothetical protein [Dehalococcoidia bacterium]